MALNDETWMRLALSLAESASALGEVPVGAVITKDDHLLSTGFNTRESRQCATCHAEIEAITRACTALASWRLAGCELHVTLEPCLMCAGAIYQARIARVVYGAADPKAGAMGSLYRVHEDLRLNHRVIVEQSALGNISKNLLQDFFRARRQK